MIKYLAIHFIKLIHEFLTNNETAADWRYGNIYSSSNWIWRGRNFYLVEFTEVELPPISKVFSKYFSNSIERKGGNFFLEGFNHLPMISTNEL